MPGNEELANLLDKLGQAALECKQLIQQAHISIKDLKRATREAETQIKSLIKEEVEKKLEEEVHLQLENLGDLTKRQMRLVAQKIDREFDKLAAPMYETLGMLDLLTKLRAKRGDEPSDEELDRQLQEALSPDRKPPKWEREAGQDAG